jgi:Ulp1 family protease
MNGIYVNQQNIDRANLSNNTDNLGDGWLNSSLIEIFIDHFIKTTNAKGTYCFSGDFYYELMKCKRIKEGPPFYNVFRWTKDVDIFAHAQLIFALSTRYHWYLTCFIDVAQCFLSNEENEQQRQQRPYILVLNSMNGNEIESAIEELKSYLIEEWIAKKESVASTDKRRHSDTSKFEDIHLICKSCISEFIYTAAHQGIGLSQPYHCKKCTDTRKSQLRTKLDIPLLRPETPQQPNTSDCGVYFLKNAEQVIVKTPKIGKYDVSLTENLNDYTHDDITSKRESMKEVMSQLIQSYREKKATIQSIDLCNEA